MKVCRWGIVVVVDVLSGHYVPPRQGKRPHSRLRIVVEIVIDVVVLVAVYIIAGVIVHVVI